MNEPAPKRLSPATKKSILILLGLLAPIAGLLGAEAICFFLGWGYPTSLFLRSGAGPAKFQVNYRAGWRFFPGKMARKPLPESFAAVKPDNGLRIFVLGESAARGESLADFSFARMLEVSLQTALPEKTVEVVNTGIPAINSWVIAEFAKEILQYQPDLLVFYMGNNEVVGPYGPGTVFTSLSRHWAIKAAIRLGEWRVVQVARSIMENWGGKPVAWRGLEMFRENLIRADDPRLRQCAEKFRANTEEMLQRAVAAGVPVMVCQVPANGQDFAPFASLSRLDLTVADKTAWEAEFQKGIAAQAAKNREAARAAFRAALAIDSGHAELLFRLGRVCAELDDPEAQNYLQQGIEADALRFRMTGAFQQSLASATAGLPPAKAVLVNLPKVFAAADGGGLPGYRLLYDHVHLTLQGHFLVHQAVVQELARAAWLPGLTATAALPLDELKARLGFAARDEKRDLESIISAVSRPPFTGRALHDDYLEGLRARLAQVTRQIEAAPDADFQIYETALRHCPARRDVLMRQGSALAEAGNLSGAWNAFLQATALQEADIDVWNNRGLVLCRQEKFAEALGEFDAALRLTPYFSRAWFNRGVALARLGRAEEAITNYRQALEIDADYVQARINWGNLLFQRDDPDGALEQYQKALDVEPRSVEAVFNRGNALHKKGKSQEALESYLQAVAFDAGFAPGYAAAGALLLDQKREREAGEYWQKAVAAAPGNLLFQKKLLRLLILSEQPDVKNLAEGISRARSLCEAAPAGDPEIPELLGIALAETGDRVGAMQALNDGYALAERLHDSRRMAEIDDLRRQLR